MKEERRPTRRNKGNGSGDGRRRKKRRLKGSGSMMREYGAKEETEKS